MTATSSYHLQQQFDTLECTESVKENSSNSELQCIIQHFKPSRKSFGNVVLDKPSNEIRYHGTGRHRRIVYRSGESAHETQLVPFGCTQRTSIAISDLVHPEFCFCLVGGFLKPPKRKQPGGCACQRPLIPHTVRVGREIASYYPEQLGIGVFLYLRSFEAPVVPTKIAQLEFRNLRIPAIMDHFVVVFDSLIVKHSSGNRGRFFLGFEMIDRESGQVLAETNSADFETTDVDEYDFDKVW